SAVALLKLASVFEIEAEPTVVQMVILVERELAVSPLGARIEVIPAHIAIKADAAVEPAVSSASHVLDGRSHSRCGCARRRRSRQRSCSQQHDTQPSKLRAELQARPACMP